MADAPDPRAPDAYGRRDVIVKRGGITVLALVAGAALVLFGMRWCTPLRSALEFATPKTTLSQDLVVEEVKSVAKLVTSETTIRDVVVWENTQYGSTKRALVVVTGKVLAGFDLSSGATVHIDDSTRTITIQLPHPKVIAVDITQMRTYDERSGLWNWFKPADSDAIYQAARTRLSESANDMGIAEHASKSAMAMLEGMFAVDGYHVVVMVAGMAPVQSPN